MYGISRASYGTATSRQGFVGQSCGHMTDPETGGLVYMRARYYDPLIGRFESEDPARDGDNWFAYCGNDPVNRVDCSGKAWLSTSMLAWIGKYCGASSWTLFRMATDKAFAIRWLTRWSEEIGPIKQVVGKSIAEVGVLDKELGEISENEFVESKGGDEITVGLAMEISAISTRATVNMVIKLLESEFVEGPIMP